MCDNIENGIPIAAKNFNILFTNEIELTTNPLIEQWDHIYANNEWVLHVCTNKIVFYSRSLSFRSIKSIETDLRRSEGK